MKRSDSQNGKLGAAGIVSLLLIVLLAGCAGTPKKEEMPEPEPAPSSGAAGVIAEAELFASNNDFESASSILEDLLDEEGQNIEALRLLASIYAAMGRKDQSASLWKEISVLDPTDSEAAYEVGVSLMRKGEWETLRSKMRSAEMSGAADSRHYLLLGEADLELGYKSEAEKYLLKATDRERARYLLGKLYYEQGKLSEAENRFKEVLQSNPDNYSAHLHLGWLYFSRKDNQRALEHYTRAVELNPGDPLSSLSLAALLEEMKKYDEAISHYRDGLALPGIPRSEKKKAYNSFSRLLVQRGRTDEAVSTIKAGLAEFPDAGGLYFQWGEVLLGMGKKAEALEKYKRAANDPVWKKVALKRIYSIQ